MSGRSPRGLVLSIAIVCLTAPASWAATNITIVASGTHEHIADA